MGRKKEGRDFGGLVDHRERATYLGYHEVERELTLCWSCVAELEDAV